MIKIYNNGIDFYNENKDFLLTNVYTEVFFRFDSELLLETNKCEYVIKAYSDNHQLLVLKKNPFSALLFGDKELVKELFDYLLDNDYKIGEYLTLIPLGDEIKAYLETKGLYYKLKMGMDFMEARFKMYPSSDIVEVAKTCDASEIYELVKEFVSECDVSDNTNIDKIKNNIYDYRIVRCDNLIVAIAKMTKATSHDKKITHVYTRKEYRGRGFAKAICTNLVNEIIDSGYIATLNVDQKNPISNHIYSSIGFKKIFSQGVYEEAEGEK